MKNMMLSLQFFLLVMLFGMLMISCHKNDIVPVDEDPTQLPADTASLADVNHITEHLQFFDEEKINGKHPGAQGASSSLKISIKDTLYLTPGIKLPVKFLHENTAENVAGVFIQVYMGSTAGTFHYAVPEVAEMEHDDSISVILIGYDPVEFDTSLSFKIKIVPYLPGGGLLDEIDVPVVIRTTSDDATGAGTCGLVLPPGEAWSWDFSYIEDAVNEKLVFYNDHDLKHGVNGQFIGGSCCNGISVYGICPDSTQPNASLHFTTYFQYTEESFKFLEDGSFARFTQQLSNNPAPNESDFCASGEGLVYEDFSNVSYFGNWTIEETTVPPDLKPYPCSYDNRNYLGLQTTSSTGFGWGNPGGMIHELSCQALILIQFDGEGGSYHLVKVYTPRSPSEDVFTSM